MHDFEICLCFSFADPPVIKEAPMSQRVKAGGIATFVCIATGDPTPHITWRKDKKAIPPRYTNQSLQFLFIYNVQIPILIKGIKSWIFLVVPC